MPTRMIKSIFFTRFHPEKGSRVLHQVPEGSITPSASPSALKQPLFHFPSITDYIIPRQEFCDRLVTTCTNRCRIIGYPVCIKGEGHYNRNEFIFNFALVLDEDAADWGSYASVVRKLGRLLRALEEQGDFLSREEDPRWFEEDEDDGLGGKDQGKRNRHVNGGHERKEGIPPNTWASEPSGNGGKVYALCEMILEDLNNYCECMIPIDDSNTINLKLFPTHLPPAPIFAWHVPLLTIDLSSFSSTISSDLTLTRILPYIDGARSVSHISQLADTDLSLTRKAVQHLVYYGCVILLDIFQFNAIYAPTAEIYEFITDPSLQEECARYVRIPHISLAHGARHERKTLAARNVLAEDSGVDDDARDAADRYRISKEHLVKLYTSLKQGVTLRSWVLENFELLTCVDVRRFITFGVIKGFLYRVHKYAIATSSGFEGEKRGREGQVRPTEEREGAGFGSEIGRELPLARYLDGLHSFDEICTELKMNEKIVLERMKGFGEVQVIHR